MAFSLTKVAMYVFPSLSSACETSTTGYVFIAFRMMNVSESAGYVSGMVKGYGRAARVFDRIPIFRLAEVYLHLAFALARGSDDPDPSGYGNAAYHSWARGRWEDTLK